MKKSIATAQELRAQGINLPFALLSDNSGEAIQYQVTAVSPKNGDSTTLLFTVKGMDSPIAITDLNKGRLIKKITGQNESEVTPRQKQLLFAVLRKLVAKGDSMITIAARDKYEDDTQVEGIEITRNGATERVEWQGAKQYLVDNILSADAYDLLEAETLKPHNMEAIKEEAKVLAASNAAKGTTQRRGVVVDDEPIIDNPAVVTEAAAVVVEEPAPAAIS